VTVAPAAKFVPAIVTAVPPATGPVFGVMLLTVGAAGSSSTMVSVVVNGDPKVTRFDLHASQRIRTTVSFGSSFGSSLMGIVTVLGVLSPSANVTDEFARGA
jgi:hypothetical protein